MSNFTIKQIFQDNWDNFVSDNQDITIRPIIFEEVNKWQSRLWLCLIYL